MHDYTISCTDDDKGYLSRDPDENGFLYVTFEISFVALMADVICSDRAISIIGHSANLISGVERLFKVESDHA